MATTPPGSPAPAAPQTLDTLVANAVAAPPSPAAPPPPPPAPDPDQGLSPFSLDSTRKELAYRLLWVMIGVIAVIMLFASIYSVRCWLDGSTCAAGTAALGILTGSVSPIFTAMVGLVGSVVGFYFGSKSSS